MASTMTSEARAAGLPGLRGKNVLVTGGSSGIGQAIAVRFADFDRVIAVNLRGAFLCAREAIRRFLGEEQAGAIVNVSSVHQLIPKPGYLGYSTSKGGDDEPHPDARTGVRRPRASASTASARARRSPRSTARGSTTRSSARRSRSTSRCSAPARPTRWPG